MHMQFHHHGYRPGSPPAIATHPPPPPFTPPTSLPAQVDVLIIGAGPAGLVCATQLSRFPSVTVALAEAKSGPLRVGQADGIQCRSIEMFCAFGFHERVLRESYWVNETVFWRPGEGEGTERAVKEGITRAGRIRDVERGLSEMPHVILNQARIHDFWLDAMGKGPRPLAPVYGRRLVEVKRGGEGDYPVTVVVEAEGKTETVRAKYVVGCDGARSAVRSTLGMALQGEAANVAWGVMDVLCVTTFPDIRFKCVVHSKEHGSMIIIPREGGYLVRLYIELDSTVPEGQRLDKGSITADTLIAAARGILAPYTMDVKEVAWWSVYEIGQRICTRFDDAVQADGGPARHPRVFIAGDACHTHSPKAGQGMNVGMQDGWNLGWKLGSVLSGIAQPELLETYNTERHAVAKELIDFDKELTGKLHSKNGDSGVDHAEFQRYFTRSGRYTAGLGYSYTDSSITALSRTREYQHLATGFPVGERFHSAPLVRFWDGKPAQLGHAVVADGRWRLFIFNDGSLPFESSSSSSTNSVSKPQSRIVHLSNYLLSSATSPIHIYTPPGSDNDATIEALFILQQPHAVVQTALLGPDISLPALFTPQTGPFALNNPHKVFCDEEPHYNIWGATGPWESVYKTRDISREHGAVVIVRPDGYVAGVCGLDLDQGRHVFLEEFFAGFMVSRT
ncbi:phenol 2-monooxygenase [Myriangium duriaei CBS 260.36]|uniref:Phenol 2-monooxygenase n=1 Tax=Myriangium duriaei CBS 260.36 TaxID=1168546 RepID=A0A9P4JC56_9PEZI|nr:phenol 2-monooxygenase [Myriangium duriaei CBS 260.36]